MAFGPYKIVDRRGGPGYSMSNSLIEAATQNTDRGRIPNLDFDVHRTVSAMGRRLLVSAGRRLFWQFPALQGAVLEQANVAVSSFIPQYTGRNKAWGTLAERALNEWHKIMDVAGWPYDYDSYLQSLVIAPIIEGENFTLLTENPDGYPMIQVIPTHRVGARQVSNQMATVRFYQEQLFIDGVLVDNNRPYLAEDPIEFEARVVDGVIVDDYARPIAYRVYDDASTMVDYQDIPARNFFPAFCPIAQGQVRGFSLLASSLFNWQDINEWNRFELIAQKVSASKTVMEWNETGDTDTTKAIIQQSATFNDDNQKTGLDVQQLAGGTYHYLKANSGAKLQAFEYNRPGSDSQNFAFNALRDAFKGTEWDVFFSLDPQKVGGAPMRIIVEKINLVAAKRRKLVKKCCMRVDGYAISKFIKLGLLPNDPDWFMWDYQGPGDVTADRKYDSDVDIQEVGRGFSTQKIACARRGLYLDDVQQQQETEADEFLASATRLSKKHGITIQEAIAVLRPPASGQLPIQQQQGGDSNPPAAQ